MKKSFSLAVLSSLFVCLLATSSFAQQTGKGRSFFAADYQKKLGALVNADNSVRWQIPIGDIHDAQPLPGGNWLLQTSFNEVQELDSQGKSVWKYVPTKEPGVERVEIHAFRRLPNGETMVAESGNSQIVILDNKKSVIHKIKLSVSKSDPHRDTRLVRPTKSGTFLVAHEGDQTVKEYDRAGKVVWEYPIGTKVYSAVRLDNGNTLLGTGDGHKVTEINSSKEVVWEISEKELPGVKLAWITMVDRLPNGNTWIVNCHAGPEQPQILEVTPDKKVVWSFLDFNRFGNALPVAVPAE